MRHAMVRIRTRALATAWAVFLASPAGCEALDEASDSVTGSIDSLGDNLDDLSNPSNPSSSSECRAPARRAAKADPACCFDSFYQAKKYLHANGTPKRASHQWHHIVGQHQANKDKFGEGDLHCTDNLLYLPRTKHEQLNSHYMSRQDVTGGKRFYLWLAPKSFDEQYRIGVEVLKRYQAWK